MKTMVFADRLGRELAPLTDRTCVALLPIANKPLIEFTLEAIAGVGLRDIVVVVSSCDDQVQRHLGDGRSWGLQLEYLITEGEAAPEHVIRQSFPQLREFLALRGDILRGALLEQFLAQAKRIPGATVYALVNGYSPGLCLCRRGPHGLDAAIRWQNETAVNATSIVTITLHNAYLSRLESLKAYHQTNLDLVAGRIAGLAAPGRMLALGLLVEYGAQVKPRSLKQGLAFIGAHSQIDPRANLSGEIALAEHVRVERYASIRSSVVLPHAYIGEFVDISNAIVHGNDIIRVDSGALLGMAETFLLADLKPATLNPDLANTLNRLLGLLLLVLSSPLWPMALLVSSLTNPRAPLRRQRLQGNRQRTFIALEWTTTIPLLRHLPRLLAVVGGRLSLVGTLPLTAEQAASLEQNGPHRENGVPVGMIGPSQLDVHSCAPLETKLLCDAFYAARRTTWRDLFYLLKGARALFDSRAWVEVRRAVK